MNLLYLPALALVLIFVLLPLVTSVKTSFYNWNGYSPVKKFVGVKNYLDLLVAVLMSHRGQASID